MDEKSIVLIIIIVLCLCFIILIPLAIFETKKEKLKKEELNKQLLEENKNKKIQHLKLKNAYSIIDLPITSGLPIPEDSKCEITLGKSKIEINGNGINFNLSINKVHDVSVKTSTDIQKQLVSNTGNAIGGAILFGTLGAIIGASSTKEKEIKTEKTYLIITYTKDENVDYIIFDATKHPEKAKDFVSEVRVNLELTPHTVEL